MIARILLALSFASVVSAQPPDLVVRITTSPYDAENRLNAIVEIETRVALRDAELITLDIRGSFLPESWTTSAGVACASDGINRLQCTLAAMPAGSKASLSFRGVPRSTSGTRFLVAELQWRDRGFRTETRTWQKDVFQFAHEYVVTHAGDSGPGSLRAAIEDATPNCKSYDEPCLIRFDLGDAAVIRPLTPLPEIRGVQVTIDGQSKVTLDGSLLTVPANGLHVVDALTGVIIRGLSIQRFPENGIELADGQSARVVSCVITNNGSRGVALAGEGHLDIEESVISGNGRSGLFLARGSARVVRNLIGVAADGVTPMPNGASGIFAAGYGVTIEDNVIANNAHFGVALSADSMSIDVGRNRIVGNGGRPIDIGLDGPSRFGSVAPGQPGYLLINGPTLLSATYDPASNKTIVTGRQENVPFEPFLTYELHFYATTAANEAHESLGGIHITKPEFTVSFPGDLRGRFITANTIRWVHDPEFGYRGTSEMGEAIEVR